MIDNQNKHKRTREEIEQLKTLCLASGKTKKRFAEENGINYMTLMSWFSKMGKQKAVAKKSGFVPVEVKVEASTPFAEIHFSNGKRIVFHQPVGVEYFQSFLK